MLALIGLFEAVVYRDFVKAKVFDEDEGHFQPLLSGQCCSPAF